MTAGHPPFDLLETMRFDPDDGIWELERHLARLKESAAALGFALDRHALRNELHAASFRRVTPARVRLRLAPGGQVAIELSDLPEPPATPVSVGIRPLPVAADDLRLRHKTSDRSFYDDARAGSGTWEVLFRHPSGQLTEGSFTSLFVPRHGGTLVTPLLALGLIPGILRESLIAEGRATEAELFEEDLEHGFLIGNAVRGLIPARLA